MKKITIRNIGTIGIILIMSITTLGIGSVRAQDTTMSLNTSCFTEWDTFVSSTISVNEFLEYWKDILVRYNRNTCYYMDIQQILKQIDTTRSALRKAILACNDKQAGPLKTRFYELQLELDYLRSFVSFADKNGRLVSEEKVYKQLKEKYVDTGLDFTEEAFNVLFDRYKTKYIGNVSSIYKRCSDGSIQQLIDRWDKLVETLKSMQADAKAVKEDFDRAVNKPPQGMKNFIKNLENVRRESLEAQKNPEEIFNETTQETGTEPTIDQLTVSINKNEQEYQKNMQQASLTAEYEALYKHGGDSLAESYEKVLTELNTIIKDSYKPLEDLKQCAKQSADRQCQ
ncbi:hypothetical protein GF369_04565 [Candidatus Peregrinibacteria bacterium]|nr:hypothetical protein [Candidatus Peregrinibacteria bacterium]